MEELEFNLRSSLLKIYQISTLLSLDQYWKPLIILGKQGEWKHKPTLIYDIIILPDPFKAENKYTY